MAMRIPITGFVSFLEQQLREGAGYIMASYGQNPRTGYLDLNRTDVKPAWKEDGYYYTQYSGKQREQALKWRRQCKRVFDCQGLAEGYYEITTGVCVNTQAKYNYQNWCSVRGSGTIPANRRVPGAAVFWGNTPSSIHHVAFLYKPVDASNPAGDWYLIEARGVMYGVVKTRLSARKPNFWGLMDKYFEYNGTTESADTAEAVLGYRDLRNGTEGCDVKEMQTGLIRLGYNLGRWGADGDFGDATELAVKQFQKDHSLTATGVFDTRSVDALEKALVEISKPADKASEVVITDGNCYIRTTGSTSGTILGVARENEVYAYDGYRTETGWLRIRYAGGTGWVSGKYGKLQ